SKYINHHHHQQQPYHNPLNNPQQLIHQTQPTLTSHTINQFTNPLTQPKSNLHPHTKLQHHKHTPKQTIPQLH
ncbi:hypothetical protein, partial [Staphylococcus epidermidis]|uniref:hypothetical protein n=1 Tax=Staphylococcus epidermidis TaxID=1282 RepID=UPI001C930108